MLVIRLLGQYDVRRDEELPPDVYAAATEDGNQRLELDTAVLELLLDPVPARLLRSA